MNKTIIITGSAKRIGKTIAEYLHGKNYNVLLHYHQSEMEAFKLEKNLNTQRPNSALAVRANLALVEEIKTLVEKTITYFGRIDGIINNASSFYTTKLGDTTESQWDDLFASNTKAAYFLIQASLAHLQKFSGAVINIADVYAQKPLKHYAVYSAAKASLSMLTKSLAVELAPSITVNGIAPGSILWPVDKADIKDSEKNKILKKIPLKRLGEPLDIAKTVIFLLQMPYITGEIIHVDGGKSLV